MSRRFPLYDRLLADVQGTSWTSKESSQICASFCTKMIDFTVAQRKEVSVLCHALVIHHYVINSPKRVAPKNIPYGGKRSKVKTVRYDLNNFSDTLRIIILKFMSEI